MIAIVVIACSASPSALRADDAADAKELKQLAGVWKLATLETDGQTREFPDNAPVWVIKGNKVLYGGDDLAVLTINASASPKTVDLAFRDPKKTYEGVYALAGDTFKLCVNRQTEGVKERPQDFATQGKSDLRFLVFKRLPAGETADDISGFVGIMIRMDEDKRHVVISDALPGSPARKAGLKKDDILLKVGGIDATDLQQVVKIVRQQKPGSDFVLRIKRDDKEKEITVKVGKLPFYLLD